MRITGVGSSVRERDRWQNGRLEIWKYACRVREEKINLANRFRERNTQIIGENVAPPSSQLENDKSGLHDELLY